MKRSQSEKKVFKAQLVTIWLRSTYLLCHAEAPTGVQYIQTSKTTRRDAMRCDAIPPPPPAPMYDVGFG